MTKILPMYNEPKSEWKDFNSYYYEIKNSDKNDEIQIRFTVNALGISDAEKDSIVKICSCPIVTKAKAEVGERGHNTVCSIGKGTKEIFTTYQVIMKKSWVLHRYGDKAFEDIADEIKTTFEKHLISILEFEQDLMKQLNLNQ